MSPAYPATSVAFSDQLSPLSTTLVGYGSPALHLSPTYPNTHFGASGPSPHSFIPVIADWGGFGNPNPGQPHGSPLAHLSGRRQNIPRGGNRAPYANNQVGQHNVVDIDRIRAGLDVRTTVSLNLRRV